MDSAPGTIYCVGRNYADHARELGNAVPDAPLIFTKASACVVPFGDEIHLPAALGRCDYETEIVLQIADPSALDRGDPRGAISHLGLALDLTRRDIQSALKAKGHPWTLAKSFIGACPLSSLRPLRTDDDLAHLTLALDVNGAPRQRGDTADLLFPIPELLLFIHQRLPLWPGDLVLTGTPAGVGPLHDGDHLEAWLQGERIAHAIVRRTRPTDPGV